MFTYNSKIMEFIASLPDKTKWKEEIEKKRIRVKIENNLAILNYDIGCDPSDPVVKEARGIIIDIEKWEIVCRPFTRFYNSFEPYADEIDWSHFRVEEKIDGSIVKLWWNKDKWFWSTNSCIDAFNTKLPLEDGTFGELIKSAVNYKDIPFEKLDKDYTYIFELVSPYNQIVIKYDVTGLYHIGTRNNWTGEEIRTYILVRQPFTYNINSYEDCLKMVDNLNKSYPPNKEGFVVVDDNWHRVKIKSKDYIIAHKYRFEDRFSKKDIIESIINKEVSSLTAIMSEDPVLYYYYSYKIEELKKDISDYITYVISLYDEFNFSRKAVALKIKNQKYASFGFMAIDKMNRLMENAIQGSNNKENMKDYIEKKKTILKEILDNFSIEMYCDMIPKYKRKDILK